MTTDRTINHSERKLLLDLLHEDFNLLRSDLRTMAAEASESQKDGIRKQQRSRVDKARRYEDQLRTLIRKAQDDGCSVEDKEGYRNRSVVLTVTADDVEKRLEQVGKDVDRDLQQAISITHKEEHKSKRKLLAATLSEEATALLNGLPKAEEVMKRAAAERRTLPQVAS